MDPALLSALGALFGHATGESTESTGDAPSASIAILTVPGRGIVGTAITPNGQDGAFPLPMGLLQNLGGQVSRVPLGSQEEAAATLGGIMSMMMEQMTRVAMQQSMEENSRKVPPASERVRDALPRIVVTKEDLMDSTNSKCSICLDDFQPGFRATRMLCSHLFCNNCIREWLREANSCPVCRYELATDCEEFEAGRRARMENRPVRLKLAELQQLRVTELKRLMKALQVSPDGCLEKAELVRRLQGASDVVLEEENAQRYSKEELEDLPLLLLRNLLERHQVPNRMSFSGEERSWALASFAAAGWIDAKTEQKEGGADGVASRKEVKETEVKEQKEETGPAVDEAGPAGPAETVSEAAKKEEEVGPVRPRPARPAGPAPAQRRPARSRSSADVYFSEEEEFSEYECEGCGSKSVNVMKKAEDRCFKVYCNDCPYVSVADMNKEAPSIRRQREIDEARARKKKEKEQKKLAEKLAIEERTRSRWIWPSWKRWIERGAWSSARSKRAEHGLIGCGDG
ncbi:unnamed protein product [Durusdinium trenchii]|uniref:E3 ubiquitin-protein ligase RNF181 n=1 Tax=Durusdinium trenchii TaxID=1381693 RepID=A0ABP0ITK4_9DINO